jgi:class 3 adenylate cyclase
MHRELLFRGLRVRMGVHVGSPRVTTDPMSLRGTYAGPVVDGAARITAVAHGGQILMSKATLRQVQDVSLAGERDRIVSLGRFTIPGLPEGSG